MKKTTFINEQHQLSTIALKDRLSLVSQCHQRVYGRVRITNMENLFCYFGQKKVLGTEGSNQQRHGDAQGSIRERERAQPLQRVDFRKHFARDRCSIVQVVSRINN